MKKVIIVHGWEGKPGDDWFPWLKRELETRGFKVEVPTMPDTEEPEIGKWIPFLKKTVKNPNEETYFVGHSIGCQTILRYLESLDENIKIGGCVFVAGWMNLIPEIIEEEGVTEIAKPWLKTSINFNKVLLHTNKIIAIFSDNDHYVPQTDSEIFRKKLNAKVITEKNKGHINVKKLQSILDSVLEISK